MTADRRRIRVTGPNLRNSTLPVTGLRDFFPAEAVGGSRRKNANGHGIELILDGLGETVVTDIGSDAILGICRIMKPAAASTAARRSHRHRC